MNDGGTYHDPPVKQPQVVEVVREESWYSLRHSKVEEVEVMTSTGPVTRYRVVVWDEGREPFVRHLFNDPAPAIDLADRIKNENERYHDIRR